MWPFDVRVGVAFVVEVGVVEWSLPPTCYTLLILVRSQSHVLLKVHCHGFLKNTILCQLSCKKSGTFFNFALHT